MNNSKYALCFLSLLCIQQVCSTEHIDPTLHIQVGAREVKKVPLALVAIGESQELDEVLDVIQHDIQFVDQFVVTKLVMPFVPHQKEIKKMKAQGYAIATFISHNPKKKTIDIRLYDVHKGNMITDKGYTLKEESQLVRGWGHAIADFIIEKLTNQLGFFSSKLVYCKELPSGKRQVCISDYDGSHEQVIATAAFAMAPRWNVNEDEPVIFYSRRTSFNLRLVQVNLNSGKEKVVVSYEGLNMLPAFSPVSDEIVLCLSCKGGNQLYSYDYDRRKRGMSYTQLTFNEGNNISPTITEEGEIIFCSDFESKPQLYKLCRKKDDELTCLSGPGDVCFSPCYSSVNHKAVYTKMVEGVGQLWIYDLKKNKHMQLTNDQGHKQEPWWSPCGNYVIFELGDGKKKQLAIQSLLTGNRHVITDGIQSYAYPSWSMNFTVFPVFLSSNNRQKDSV